VHSILRQSRGEAGSGHMRSGLCGGTGATLCGRLRLTTGTRIQIGP